MSSLLILALLVDLSVPALIWVYNFPWQFSLLSHVIWLLIMFRSFFQLALSKRILPKPIWIILVFSIIGTTMGLLNGQGIVITAWGWWLMFRGPFVGLFAYLQPHWHDHFSERLRVWCIVILVIEVGFQIVMYMGGAPIGDQLGGTLGEWGTQHLALVVLWVTALEFGEWIVYGKTAQLLIVLCLGATSSLFGELKIFFVAIPLMGIIALTLLLMKHRSRFQEKQILRRVGALIVGSIILFTISIRIMPEEQILNYEILLNDPFQRHYYLNKVEFGHVRYDVGRSYALKYVWDRIGEHPTTLLLGEGLGSRAESKTMGIAGAALVGGDLGLFSGSSLVVMLGELGVMGLITFLGWWLWSIRILFRAITNDRNSGMTSLDYGLFIYTLMWPVWLWYASAWTYPVSTLLYWTAFGYVYSHFSAKREK